MTSIELIAVIAFGLFLLWLHVEDRFAKHEHRLRDLERTRK